MIVTHLRSQPYIIWCRCRRRRRYHISRWIFILYICDDYIGDVWTLRLVSTSSDVSFIVVVLVYMWIKRHRIDSMYFSAVFSSSSLFSRYFVWCQTHHYIHSFSHLLSSNIESTYLNKNSVKHFIFIVEQCCQRIKKKT